MERKTATPLDISLVVAAADVVGRYANQNPMSKMELAIMIADVHSLLVERVDWGPEFALRLTVVMARPKRLLSLGFSRKPTKSRQKRKPRICPRRSLRPPSQAREKMHFATITSLRNRMRS